MKLSQGLTASSAVTLSLATLSLLAQDVFARPSPEPKASWIRKGHGRKAISDVLRGKRDLRRSTIAPRNESASCAGTLAADVTAPKKNVWGELADTDAAAVAAWLFAQPEFNLTVSERATAWDNSVVLIETIQPNKTDALAYIDGNSTAPQKWAKVILDMRATDEPYYQEIMVGPLPLQNSTVTWTPLSYPLTKDNGGKVRNLEADSDDALYTQWLYPIGESVVDITLDLWNGTAVGMYNDTLAVWGIDPLWQDDGRIIRWDTFWNLASDDFDAETLSPLGLFFKSDVTGRDPSQWKLEGWLYNGVFYETTEDFRKAYWSPGFEKLGPNVEGDWGRTDQQGPVLPMDTLYPPTMVAPSGSRFGVDFEEKYVEWMDFSFYIGFSRDTGISLHNIKYKGERLIYELALQEALAHYAGNDPVQSGTSYLDSYYGFGPYAFELVPGWDCPTYATYLNTSFYVSETTHTHLNSICMFEYDADFPIQRHSNSKYVAVTKNTYFSVRSVSTVGNYDYMFTYTFYLDGSMGVEVRASGYIQSAYFAQNQDYGFHIHDHLSGSMHDHVLNWKVDFDILGTENSVQLMKQTPVTTTYPWSGNKTRNTMKLQRSFVESEDDSRLNWDFNAQTQVLIVNQDEKNKYGELRGYRILPSNGYAHLTVQNSSNLVNAAHWAEYDIQVTRQKDTEPRGGHAYNSQDVHDPPVNFEKFFDGESLLQEDLVVWFNLGMHHVPHTGDLPNTVFTTAHSGITIMPSNYFEIDQSRSTVNMVRIKYNEGVTTDVETFGQKETSGTCDISYAPTEAELWDYKGDVVVRKFPYDPNNPYYETDSIV
ncbi:Amiloride-sensitive amine oxidase [copper-containing] [Cytospora mali]|uniref:Amine oxidase n=1 Tax=Cytospora mali TaxID=578113 RepID=A0A194VNJ8_CYTMA|nr:Amiloride-sensitive amine oxidase [copper-containing] [Valsa mali]